MKAVTIIKYECGVCGERYYDVAKAVECEQRPVTQSKGVKVGDTIKIISGGGQGRGIVIRIDVIQKSWAEHQWLRYWHTERLIVDCLDSYGSRVLTFDDYEVIK